MTDIIDITGPATIIRDGAYRMPMDVYHSQCCAGPSISSSGLRTIFRESPWHFWSKSDLNPNRYPEKEAGDGLILGKAAHALILGDEVFDDLFVYVPPDAPQRPTKTQIEAYERNGVWSEAAAERAAFWVPFDAKAEGKHMLTADQAQKIAYMAENLHKNSLAVEVLTGGLVEISMIWQDEQTGVWIKSRPDMLPVNGFDVADLKTYAPQMKDIKRAAQRAVTDHGYDMQMALGIEGAERVFKSTATRCILVMCQTTEPYTVTLVVLDADTLHFARVKNRHAINLFAHGIETGEWPMPVEEFMTYTAPDIERIKEMQIEGLLPTI